MKLKDDGLSFRFPWKRRRAPRPQADDFAAALVTRALAILDPHDRRLFIEQEIAQAFACRRVELLLRPEGPERFTAESVRVRDVMTRVLGILDGIGQPFLNRKLDTAINVAPMLQALEATYAFPVSRGKDKIAVLVMDTLPVERMDADKERSVLRLCEQLAVILENSRLLEGKIKLELQMARQAELAQLGEMTARIAHEIKNPLSSIKTIVQVMREDPQLQAGYGRDLELIQGEVDRLATSVSQLLSFARPSPEHRGTTRLQDVVPSTLQFLARDLAAAGAKVVEVIPSGLPAVVGTDSIYREILLNLILNALQAGGTGLQLLLHAEEGVLEDTQERFVLFRVEDDGPGIPADDRGRVFQPFFTTRQRGTGLGLAIVRRHVEGIGGLIDVESPARDGRGTRFVLHLPLG